MNLRKTISIMVALFSLFSALVLQADHPKDASKILPIKNSVTYDLPDFAAISDVKSKKRKFFNFLLPMIRESNSTILDQRTLLLEIRGLLENDAELTESIIGFIGRLSSRYQVEPNNDLLIQLSELLVKVDVVPESLVMAQAANESGWGTSRFAQQANNLFGVWCFTPGCGITPLSRSEGLTHEVARYDSVNESINAYIHTLNTNPAYVYLRQIRAESRAEANILNGLALAEGLTKYSERGSDYVKEIQQLIRVNKLQEFNQPV